MTNQNPIPLKYALLNAKCARCRKGDMFKPGLINQKMHLRCAECDLFYERHPGYFYVSMFVSYAISVAQVVTLSIATYVLSGGSENPFLYLLIIMGATILLSPFNFKFSRVLHMHFLDPGLKYQPDFVKDESAVSYRKEKEAEKAKILIDL